MYKLSIYVAGNLKSIKTWKCSFFIALIFYGAAGKYILLFLKEEMIIECYLSLSVASLNGVYSLGTCGVYFTKITLC